MDLTILNAVAPVETYDEDPLDLMDEIDELKKSKDAAILAHF